MTEGEGDYLSEEESLRFGVYQISADLAAGCRNLRDMCESAEYVALVDVVNTLMTELWDQGFSQTEIRRAFNAALDDMDRYAAGEERR